MRSVFVEPVQHRKTRVTRASTRCAYAVWTRRAGKTGLWGSRLPAPAALVARHGMSVRWPGLRANRRRWRWGAASLPCDRAKWECCSALPDDLRSDPSCFEVDASVAMRSGLERRAGNCRCRRIDVASIRGCTGEVSRFCSRALAFAGNQQGCHARQSSCCRPMCQATRHEAIRPKTGCAARVDRWHAAC